VTVFCPIPEIIDFKRGAEEVFRGSTVYLGVNASDQSKTEDELEVTIYYRRQGSLFWDEDKKIILNANDHYIGSDPDGFWLVPFTPPTSATLGDYEFKVWVSNGIGPKEQVYNTSEYIVEVKNNLPEGIDLSIQGSNYVIRGESIVIYAKGMDVENGFNLKNATFEYKSPEISLPWSSLYLSDLSFNPTNEEWSIIFTPDSPAPLGLYDFRVKFEDMDDEYGEYIYAYDLVNVLNSEPEAINISLESNQILRGNTIYVYANGTDFEDTEVELLVHFEYSYDERVTWESDYFGILNFIDTAWVVEFTPTLDAHIGDYIIRVQFEDLDGNRSLWMEPTEPLQVNNNKPDVGIDDPTQGGTKQFFTGDSVSLSATVSDVENSLQDLTFEWDFQFDGISDSTSRNPTHIFNTSGIKFIKLRVTDQDGEYSESILIISIFNSPPDALEITVPPEVKRGTTVVIRANGEDYNDLEQDLTPYFEYSADGGTTWETTFFDTPQYQNENWIVEFTPASDAEIASYKFRVRFKDLEGNFSEWLESSTSLGVMNNAPEVSINDPSLEGAFELNPGDEIQFSAIVTDEENPNSNLTYEWDFGDGGTSTLTTPTHTYEKAGNYTVTLKITDQDGSITTEEREITIVEPKKDDGPGINMMFVILMILLVVIAAVVLFLVVSRKKDEDQLSEPETPTSEERRVRGPTIVEPLPKAWEETAGEPLVKPKLKSIQCPICSETFQADVSEGGTIQLKCPNCGASGKVKV
jgi:PKD repeat protein